MDGAVPVAGVHGGGRRMYPLLVAFWRGLALKAIGDYFGGMYMLVTDIAHATGNDYLSARFRLAFEFLSRGDLASLPLGRNEISGDDVFANIQEYDTVAASEKQFEAHRRYYDVQFVVSGEEAVQYVPLESACLAGSFDLDADFGLYDAQARVSEVVLRAGDLAVLAPEDAHKPGCSLGEGSSHVRKIVVKVRTDQSA